jgi:hypothetical protein
MKFLYNDWNYWQRKINTNIHPRTRPMLLPSPVLVENERISLWVNDAYRILKKMCALKLPMHAGGFEKPSDQPDCMTLDFALCQNDKIELVEASAFPNINMLGFELETIFNCERRLNGVSIAERKKHFKDVVTNGERVLMIDSDPFAQLTAHEFSCCEEFATIASLKSILAKENRYAYNGNYYNRLYNRVIPFDASPKESKQLFELLENVNASSIYGHPYWRYALAKQAQNNISDANVPHSFNITKDTPWRPNYVIKPAYGYGGKGVNLTPSRGDWNAVEGKEWLAQRTIQSAVAVHTPKGTPLQRWLLTNILGKFSENGFFSMTSHSQSANSSLSGISIIISDK